MKRVRERVGDVVKVPFDETHHTYARILNSGNFAFYDAKTDRDEEDLDALISRPLLFVILVDKGPVPKGEWPVVGNIPLEPHLRRNPPKYMQDIANPTKFRIYDNGEIRPATKEECLGLERTASWSAENVRQRLRDHYAGADSDLIRDYGPLRN